MSDKSNPPTPKKITPTSAIFLPQVSLYLQHLADDPNSSAPLDELVERMQSIGEMGDSILIHAVVLLNRFLAAPGSTLKSKMAHFHHIGAVFTVAVFISQKFIQDCEIWFLEEYETITLTDRQSVKRLEEVFLEVIDYRAMVTRQQIKDTVKQICKKTPVPLSKLLARETAQKACF